MDQCVAQSPAVTSDMPLPAAEPSVALQDQLGQIAFAGIVAAIEAGGPSFGAAQQIQLYRQWLLAGGGRNGDGYAAWFNMGVIYARCGDRESAIVAYQQALVLKPNFNGAAINLGLSLEATGASDAALAVWQGSMQPDHERTALLNQQGRMLEQLGRLQEAEQLLNRSLRIDSAQPDVIQHWVHLRQKMCLWPILDDMAGVPVALARDACGPLAALALTDDVATQCAVIASWITRKTVACNEHLAPSRPYGHRRIRIGYLSSDFCKHAMSYLIVELFERHDRERFELFGYCSSREDGSDIRRRVLAAFDHVRFVGQLDDEQAARMIRADEIDILIDLNGLTLGSRLQVLRWKPAPLQTSYLGFVGPLPLPELDALLCDTFVIPPEQSAHYLPRPLPIDGPYQANERYRAVAQGVTRETVGLPPDAFVFCCFCGHFKITETMFAAWMEIMRQAPDTVLWLVDDNAWSRETMQSAAMAAGVDSSRLIFAARAAPEVYMARLKLANLFLDTFPYNAGTVASDAIRMQLPIVTLAGRSFASRMAARLLDVYGVSGGVAHSVLDYVERAVSLATAPSTYLDHRAQFNSCRWDQTLGDSNAFARSFEQALLCRLQEKTS